MPKLYIESWNWNSLSNYQLYELSRNEKLDPDIKALANSILNERNLDNKRIRELEAKHDLLFLPKSEQGLELYQKILLVVCPVFIVIHSLIAGRLFAKGQIQKWKDYWFYLSIGFLVWTVVVLFYAKFVLFK